ncbi:hypothetical protein BOTBODRAFT_37246 [Botryobasidium botryosum FD-172 SS1]|uniref:NAD(P)-binding protein n=1 Tax=Botryobasidium botryosum (strain FD-172 SS1) TaxID=930990 RepID=A0A067M0S2_BOTB1|nr:hypothetical protein BOTBODRAFT_37246 [Botryobasidium botryosum FD-172 SS1]
MKLTRERFLKEQNTPTKPVVKADLSGKTVLVVGANTGLGREAARHLASMNAARVILGCRSLEKGDAAAEDIKKSTGNPNVEVMLVDLLKLSSVVDFANHLKQNVERLDYLLLNAGIAIPTYQASDDGIESNIQVNHISTALVAILLYPLLLDTATKYSVHPRLVVTTSGAHYLANFDSTVLNAPNILEFLGSKDYCESDGVMGARYFVTKVLNVFFIRALNQHAGPQTPVIIDTVNPGFCLTEFSRHSNEEGKKAAIQRGEMPHTAEEGSRTLIYGALGGKDEEMRGAYVEQVWEVREPSDFVIDEQGVKLQERLWNETVERLAQVTPDVESTVKHSLNH